jgi:hypothetical protein
VSVAGRFSAVREGNDPIFNLRPPTPKDDARALASFLEPWRTVRVRKRLTIPGPDRDLVEVPVSPEEQAAIEAEDERFRAWWREFRLSKAGMEALRFFERARLSIRRRTDETVRADISTLNRLGRACFYAATWEGPPRDNAKARVRLRRKMAHHATELSKALAEDDPALSWDLWEAESAAWVGFVDRAEMIAREIRDEIPMERLLPHERNRLQRVLADAQAAAPGMRLRGRKKRWQDFFAALAESLRKAPRVPRRPTWKRGNLIYPTRRKNGVPIMDKSPRVETMLGFELVFHLRRWSLGLGSAPWQHGEPMPERGRPHYAVAAAFVRAALKRDITAETLKERLKSLPATVQLGMWPQQEAARGFGVWPKKTPRREG